MQPTIVVGYHGLDGADDALAFGAELARATGARLVPAYVIEQVVGRTADVARRLLRRPEAIEGGLQLTVRVGASPAAGLAALAAEREAAAIVLGSSHRAGLSRVLVGATPERLLHNATCPVALAPRGHAAAGRTLGAIGVAYDGRSP
ncbi:MAG TPA: universal stress protein, partial [Conexibacter sp.]|nr:universal stress protein [Conexibacter sp.]